MCTVISLGTKDHYFGRNLDLEYSYRETITITPRCFPFPFRMAAPLIKHHALIGMAYVVDNYPLYYDATNEVGLSMAGLNFPGNAYYPPIGPDSDNIAPFELIPWVLGQCSCVEEAERLLTRTRLANINFSAELPLTPLHWMISDSKASIVAEPIREGLKIYKNPVGVLTNNPPFDYQLFALNNYMSLSTRQPDNLFSSELPLENYSRGMGALGLPGDLSSQSRFVRAAFTKLNSVSASGESESISQFFHILGSVEQQRGCVCMGENKYEITVYSSCCNTVKGIYYYTTYENRQITAVDMHNEDLMQDTLINYPLVTGQQIKYLN